MSLSDFFLGLVKTHFYHIWVQHNVLRKTKELRSLHSFLAEVFIYCFHQASNEKLKNIIQLKMPAKLGRLPSLIGEPAGGSLTADQWLVFATVVAPLAVCSLTCYRIHY